MTFTNQAYSTLEHKQKLRFSKKYQSYKVYTTLISSLI